MGEIPMSGLTRERGVAVIGFGLSPRALLSTLLVRLLEFMQNHKPPIPDVLESAEDTPPWHPPPI
jgi:hypothetical protein